MSNGDAWMFLYTECDSCVNLLLDDVEILNYNLTIMSHELKNISAGVLALLRLERINNTVHELRVSQTFFLFYHQYELPISISPVAFQI